jgi:hypothetical protein
MEKFFVSYTQTDRRWAEWIAVQLEDAGYETFVQAWDIRPGADFMLAMDMASAESDRTIAVLSPAYLKSQFTQPEWAAARVQDPTGKLGLLVPVRIAEVELRGLLVTLVYIDLVGLTEAAAKEALLSGVLRGRAKPSTPPAFPGITKPTYPVAEPTGDDPLDDWNLLDVKTDDEGRLLLLFRDESTRITELSQSQPDVHREALRLEEHAPGDKRFTDRLLLRDAERPGTGEHSRIDHQPEFFKLLYNLLVPDSIREGLRGSRRLCLKLDGDAARYPWELLTDPADGAAAPPLSVRTTMLRLPPPSGARLKNPNLPSELTALVIGQPLVGDVPESEGAWSEAVAVSNLLREEGCAVVHSSVGEDALAVMSALFAKDYRIMHFVGRGTYVPGNPAGSGLILGDGLVLTPAELGHLGSTPDLVFINFGHLGADRQPDSAEHMSETTDPLRLLAASFAESLMRMGVPAVVISGWPVDDAAGLTFAVEFYRAILTGQPYGESVKRARALTYEVHPGSTAWGAFHCYGSPAFSLGKPSLEGVSNAPDTPPERLSDKNSPS